MVSYNITALSNVDSVGTLFQYANNSAGGVLFGIIIMAVFFIMLLVMKRWEFDKALLSSSFACFILAMLLSFAGLLNFMFVLIFLVIMAFTALYVYINR